MRLRVTAPARLHFGLLQIDSNKPHCYGGLGLLLHSPGLQLCLEPSEQFELQLADDLASEHGAKDALQSKALEAIQSAARYFTASADNAYRISIHAMPRLHCGLGMGTQLACAVVTAYAALKQYESTGSLDRHAQGLWENLESGTTARSELAKASGRGKRSHIGLEGFLRGGWIFDEGGNTSAEQQQTARPVSKTAFPDTWQVLLFLNDHLQGLSGSVEQASFDRGQSDNGQVSSQMYDLAVTQILPSLETKDHELFSDAIRRYNQLAGELFIQRSSPTRIQKYAHQLGELLDSLNVTAFGQTSWGPTMWAIVPKTQLNDNFIESIHLKLKDAGLEHVSVQLAEVSANGASLEVLQ